MFEGENKLLTTSTGNVPFDVRESIGIMEGEGIVDISGKSEVDKLKLLSNLVDILSHDDHSYFYVEEFFISPVKQIDNERQALSILIQKSGFISSTRDTGKRVYESSRDELEKDHFGEYVAIDSEEGKIVAIARTPLEVIKKAEKIKSKSYFTRRIGNLPRLR